MPFRFVRIKPGPDWLCFARSAPFAVTHGAPPPSAVIPAEGGWATWHALTGTPQTDPAASVGFVSQHWHGEQNHFPVMDLEPVRTRELALFRKSGEAPACRSNPQSTIRSPKPSAAPVGFVSHGRRLLRFVQARLVGTPERRKMLRLYTDALTCPLPMGMVGPIGFVSQNAPCRSLGCSDAVPAEGSCRVKAFDRSLRLDPSGPTIQLLTK